MQYNIKSSVYNTLLWFVSLDGVTCVLSNILIAKLLFLTFLIKRNISKKFSF